MATTKTVRSGNFDFNVGRGQLGFASFFTLTQPITVVWVDAFVDRPARYYITPNGANNIIRLPQIGDGFNQAAVGHVFNIQNMSGLVQLLVQNSSGGLIMALNPGVGLTLVCGSGGVNNYITDVSGGGGGASMKPAQLVIVAESGGDFTSIAAAVASIVDATASKPYDVQVAPGTYNEPQIVMKQYVSITGFSQNAIFVTPQNPNVDLIVAASNNVISGMTISGVTGATALAIIDVSNFIVVNISIGNSQVGIKTTAPLAAVSNVYIRNWLFTSGATSQYAMWIDGRAITSTQSLHIDLFTSEIQNNNTLTNGLRIEGPFASIDQQSCLYEGNGAGVGVYVDDGAQIDSFGDSIHDWNIGLHVDFNGSAPNVRTSALLVVDSTTLDVNILSNACTGVLNGIFRRGATVIDPLAPIRATFTDPVVPGMTIIGALYLGEETANNENAVPLIKTTSPLGVIDGGVLTNSVGLTINVTAGFGYLISLPFPNHTLKLISWSNTSIVVPANTTSYIFFNSVGTLTSNAAEPDRLANIILGRVRAAAATIEFIDSSSIKVLHGLNSQVDLNRDVLGPRVASGLITTFNGLRQLSVTNGRYYFGIRQFNPTGGAFPITFAEYYHSAGAFTFTSGVTVVNNTQYDDGTNLVPLTAGFFAKHSLYIVGEGVNERYLFVFSQDEYGALVDAQSAFLPIPPNYFDEGVMIISSIIVQQGNPLIVQVRDERPVIGGNPTGIGGTSDHGALLGLLDDDHPQYVLTNGGRVMTGDLNLGTNDIINAGTYNGIDLALHGARHLPSGLDPLVTAAPTSNLTPLTTNAVGIANSFARSDHSHALPTAAPLANLTATTTNATGTAASFARSDHSHAITTGAPTATFTPNSTNATGTSANIARADHGHQFATAAPLADLTPTTTNAAGTAASFARSDHSHALPTAAPLVNLSTSSTNATGTANSFSRSDHSHAIDFPVFGTQYQSASATATTSSTSQFPTWNNKINFTTISVPAGTYRISYCLDWTMSATTRDILIEVQVDGVTEARFRDRSETVTGTGTGNEGLGAGTGNDRRYKCAGFFFSTFGAAATHNIIFRFTVNNAGSGTPIASTGAAFVDFFRTS